MSALCYSVKTLFTEHEGEVKEINFATTFFFKKILPQLVTGVESCVPQVRGSALDNLLVALGISGSSIYRADALHGEERIMGAN